MSVSEVVHDDRLLVQMLADGAPYRQIAKITGLSVSMIGKIARGDNRRVVSHQVHEVKEARRQALRDAAARRAADLMNAHVEEGLKAGGETARKCREFIIGHLLEQDDNPADLFDTLLAGPVDAARPAAGIKPKEALCSQGAV
ncbi:MAG: hypothetical protein ABFD92_15670 [Planctomycetaceae bacterium]|nr:hypothetical protein [Planctomycetaceae bacterium]